MSVEADTNGPHKNFQFWEPSLDFPVPHQNRVLAVEEQPYAEAAGSVLSIQRHYTDSFDGWCWEGKEQFGRRPCRSVKPANRRVNALLSRFDSAHTIDTASSASVPEENIKRKIAYSVAELNGYTWCDRR